MRADTNLLIAGVLHDTVEDTDTTLDEIREIFGDDVAELVASNSEDKSKTWDERKQHPITEPAKADNRVKMLLLADKLSNIRSIAYDYRNIGDELWKRFNAPKEKQACYYSGIQDSIFDMQLNSDCAEAYWEFVGLYKDVFVNFVLKNFLKEHVNLRILCFFLCIKILILYRIFVKNVDFPTSFCYNIKCIIVKFYRSKG